MSLRELAAAALSSQDMTSVPHVQGQADIVAALATAPPLGRALWRYAYSRQDAAAAGLTQLLVSDCLRRYRWAPTAALCRLAMLAVYEWTEPACRICGGRTGYMLYRRWLGCPVCAESGLRRYSNNSRRRFMGEWNQGFEAKLYLLLRQLSDADSAVLSVLRRHLGSNSGIDKQLSMLRGISDATTRAHRYLESLESGLSA